MKTLDECLREIYEDAFKEVREGLEREALTEEEVLESLWKRVKEFEGSYARDDIPFSDEMISTIDDEFFKLIEERLKVKPQRKIIQYRAPTSDIIFETETAFFNYSEKAIEDKIRKMFDGYIVENILPLPSDCGE